MTLFPKVANGIEIEIMGIEIGRSTRELPIESREIKRINRNE